MSAREATDNKIYEKMAANAFEDAAQYDGKEYDGENEFVSARKTVEGVEVFDAMDAPFERTFTIADPRRIDAEWIEARIVATPSAERLGLDVPAVAEWVFSSLRKHTYSTLSRLVFVGDDIDADMEFLAVHSAMNDAASGARLLDEHRLPDDGQLGILWHMASVAVVSIGNIVDGTKEMVASGEIFPHEEADCINHGVLATVAHELRHLEQSNPYVPDDVFAWSGGDDEEDAEAFARRICERCHAWVIGGERHARRAA